MLARCLRVASKPTTVGIGRAVPRCRHATAATGGPHRAAAMPADEAASREGELRVGVTAGGLGHIVLCRDRELNSIDADLMERIRAVLLGWLLPSSGIRAVLLDSCTPRAFCSGGDVKHARQAVLDAPYADMPPPGHHIHRVFQAEYSLVTLLAAYPRPIISLYQGVWMGMGVGLAVFGRHRVVTDSTVFAMPENAIGLWPDGGFAHKVAALPGSLGLALALTGAKVNSPADLLHTRLATHYVPEGRMEELRQELLAATDCSPFSLEWALSRSAAPPGPLQQHAATLHRLFGGMEAAALQGAPSGQVLGELLGRLQQEQQVQQQRGDAGSSCAALLAALSEGLRYASPGSLALTLHHYAAVRRDVAAEAGGPLASLEAVMQREYAMAVRRIGSADFCEGVRAALVDKDRRPAWRPAHLSKLDAVMAVRAPLPDPSLGLQLDEVQRAVAAAASRA